MISLQHKQGLGVLALPRRYIPKELIKNDQWFMKYVYQNNVVPVNMPDKVRNMSYYDACYHYELLNVADYFESNKYTRHVVLSMDKIDSIIQTIDQNVPHIDHSYPDNYDDLHKFYLQIMFIGNTCNMVLFYKDASLTDVFRVYTEHDNNFGIFTFHLDGITLNHFKNFMAQNKRPDVELVKMDFNPVIMKVSMNGKVVLFDNRLYYEVPEFKEWIYDYGSNG